MWLFKSPKRWREFSAEEVQRHNMLNSLWIVGNNSVYDATNIIAKHPGGSIAILQCGGGRRDCTVDHFFHSSGARNLWNQFKIGEISKEEKDKLAKVLYEKNEKAKSDIREKEEAHGMEACSGSPSPSTLCGEEYSIGSSFLNSPDWIVYSSWSRNQCPLHSTPQMS